MGEGYSLQEEMGAGGRTGDARSPATSYGKRERRTLATLERLPALVALHPDVRDAAWFALVEIAVVEAGKLFREGDSRLRFDRMNAIQLPRAHYGNRSSRI